MDFCDYVDDDDKRDSKRKLARNEKRSQTISVYVLRTSIIVANDFKQKAETQSFPKSGETIKHDLLNVKINK